MNITTRTLVTESKKINPSITRTKWSRQSPNVNHHGKAEVNWKRNMASYWCVKNTQVATRVD